MEPASQQTLVRLIRNQRVAALGTLRDGAPFVSMVSYAVANDLSAYYLHISKLAQHTQDILKDSRVSLMIAETDAGDPDPQTLARVSIQGEAVQLAANSDEVSSARAIYLARFPDAEMRFSLGDFALYRIEPRNARFVAGFGKTYNLTLEDFKKS